MKKYLSKVIIGTLAVAFALGLNYLYAWTAPASNPPNGNVATPINAGVNAQVKNGALSVNAFSAFGSAYVQGNLGIGAASPQYQIDLGPGGTGIRFPDGSVQTSAGGGGGGSVVLFNYVGSVNQVANTIVGWQTTALNTKKADASNIGTLSGNRITLPVGKYEVEGFVPVNGRISFLQARVQNVTTGTTAILGPVVLGTDESSGGNGLTPFTGIMDVTDASHQYEVQLYAATAGYPYMGYAGSGLQTMGPHIKFRKI